MAQAASRCKTPPLRWAIPGIVTGAVFPNTGLNVLDTNASPYAQSEARLRYHANRTLTLTTGDADRTLTLTGSASIIGTNTGDVTVGGETYATIAGQVITFAPVDLATTEITGILEAVNGGTGQPSYNKGDISGVARVRICSPWCRWAPMGKRWSRIPGKPSGCAGAPRPAPEPSRIPAR